MNRKQLEKGITIKVLNPNVKARHWLPTLTESDIQLVSMWSQSVHSNLNRQSIIENYGKDWVLGRLLSARSAEKVAAEFYGNYGKTVRDISVTQIEEKPQSDWRIHDVDVEGVPVDVKNSRAYKNRENRYSEYCIPQFKRNRENHEVTIAGVYSPYLWPCEILNLSEYSREFRILFLGETNQSKLEKLRKEFNCLVEFRGVARPPRLLDPKKVAVHELYMFEAAIACPVTDIVVHPFVLAPDVFGLSKEGFSEFGSEVMGHVDQKRLINLLDIASQRGIGIEISPKFIKYNQRHLVEFYQMCLDREVKLMVGSDAHNAEQLEELALLELVLKELGVSEEHLWRPKEWQW